MHQIHDDIYTERHGNRMTMSQKDIQADSWSDEDRGKWDINISLVEKVLIEAFFKSNYTAKSSLCLSVSLCVGMHISQRKLAV
jgi:hypothetical protein